MYAVAHGYGWTLPQVMGLTMRQMLRALRELRRRNAQDDMRMIVAVSAAMSDGEGRRATIDKLTDAVEHDSMDEDESSRIIAPGDAIRGLKATLVAYGQR